jgi:signal transduction histidine kinase
MGATLFSPENTGSLRPYLFSIIAFLAAWLVRDALTPVVGQSLPHATFMVATAFSAWFLGLGPGLLTMILGLPAADYFFTPPVGAWSAFTAPELPSTLTYLIASSALVAMGVSNRRRTVELEQKNREVIQQADAVQLSNERLRELSMRLLHTQDEERRHIARELHDSVGQYLTAIAIMLSRLKGSAKGLPPSALEQLEEAEQAVRSCSSEVRTISHLLHPPLLEEVGLASAARWYVQGFAERSGIQVQVEIPENLQRLGDEPELVLFRILQETLTNVHRHSGSKVAAVRIDCDGQKAWLEVRDQGKGLPQDSRNAPRPGVGIRGMQERVRELAGTLEFFSDSQGMRVRAVIPVGEVPRMDGLSGDKESDRGARAQGAGWGCTERPDYFREEVVADSPASE